MDPKNVQTDTHAMDVPSTLTLAAAALDLAAHALTVAARTVTDAYHATAT